MVLIKNKKCIAKMERQKGLCPTGMNGRVHAFSDAFSDAFLEPPEYGYVFGQRRLRGQ